MEHLVIVQGFLKYITPSCLLRTYWICYCWQMLLLMHTRRLFSGERTLFGTVRHSDLIVAGVSCCCSCVVEDTCHYIILSSCCPTHLLLGSNGTCSLPQISCVFEDSYHNMILSSCYPSHLLLGSNGTCSLPQISCVVEDSYHNVILSSCYTTHLLFGSNGTCSLPQTSSPLLLVLVNVHTFTLLHTSVEGHKDGLALFAHVLHADGIGVLVDVSSCMRHANMVGSHAIGQKKDE